MKRIALWLSRRVGRVAWRLDNIEERLYDYSRPPRKQVNPEIQAILTDGLLRLREHAIMPRIVNRPDDE